MAFPEPVPGLVIRYSYLWTQEHKRGQEEGVKDRPCAVVLVTANDDGNRIVTVLPVTHTPPSDLALAVEIPPLVKRRLNPDFSRCLVERCGGLTSVVVQQGQSFGHGFSPAAASWLGLFGGS